MNFTDLFTTPNPVIACIHLMSLPGSPGYNGDLQKIFDVALQETAIYKKHGITSLIIENFRDIPFFADRVPAETIASMSAVIREIVNEFNGVVGVNVLRNDATAAMAIAASTGADFIRVNVHTGAALTDQGMIQGNAAETLRLKSTLKSKVLILADVHVKHASPLGNRGIAMETKDIADRGMADGIIVTGNRTGGTADLEELKLVKQNTSLPVIVGSGILINNLKEIINYSDGMIVGSYFKKDGMASNLVEESRVSQFMNAYDKLR
jgi:hypothetical protein